MKLEHHWTGTSPTREHERAIHVMEFRRRYRESAECSGPYDSTSSITLTPTWMFWTCPRELTRTSYLAHDNFILSSSSLLTPSGMLDAPVVWG